MFLKCQAEPTVVCLMEAENFHQFHIDCGGMNRWIIDNILTSSGAGLIEGSKAWIRYEFLVEAGKRAGLLDDWQLGLEKMIAYADSHGWVRRHPDVQLSAHLENVDL